MNYADFLFQESESSEEDGEGESEEVAEEEVMMGPNDRIHVTVAMVDRWSSQLTSKPHIKVH